MIREARRTEKDIEIKRVVERIFGGLYATAAGVEVAKAPIPLDSLLLTRNNENEANKTPEKQKIEKLLGKIYPCIVIEGKSCADPLLKKTIGQIYRNIGAAYLELLGTQDFEPSDVCLLLISCHSIKITEEFLKRYVPYSVSPDRPWLFSLGQQSFPMYLLCVDAIPMERDFVDLLILVSEERVDEVWEYLNSLNLLYNMVDFALYHPQKMEALKLMTLNNSTYAENLNRFIDMMGGWKKMIEIVGGPDKIFMDTVEAVGGPEKALEKTIEAVGGPEKALEKTIEAVGGPEKALILLEKMKRKTKEKSE